MALKPVNDPIRIPIIGSYNSRLFYGSSGSTAGVIGVGVVGTFIIGAAPSAVSKDQKFVNVIPDVNINPVTNHTRYYVYKRPGFTTNTTPGAGNGGTAIKIWTGKANEIISAFGTTNSTVYNGTSSLGTTTGVVYDIQETFVGTTANLTFASDGNKAYYYPDGGALTEIVDADFPSNAGKTITGNFVHMDGYAFIMATDGNIYNSDLNSLSSWGALSFIAANTYPDRGIGLARYKELVVAFGKESVEFFRNVGNPTGSPLEKVKEATIKIGCIGYTAITSFEDNIAWVAGSDTGTESVYILDGYKPVRVSDNAIDAFIAQRGDTTIYMTSSKINGKTLIFVQFNSQTYVYCLEDKLWHEWSPGDKILWHKFAASSSSTSALYTVSRTSTSGKVYKISLVNPVYQDDGTSYTVTIQTSLIDLGKDYRKRLRRFSIIGDTSTSTTNMGVSWTDDDYTTYTTARNIDLNKQTKYLTNCGQFRRRAFNLTETSSLPLRLEALEFNIDTNIH